MTTSKIVVLAVLGLFMFFGFGYVVSAMSFRSDCVAAEAGLKAQYDQDRNNYDNFWKKVKEVSQVPEMYAADLQKVYDSAIGKRYGESGSKAMFQVIREHNPNFDSSMYVKIQSVIEAGRNSFADDQKQLLDRKRQYETLLNGNGALAVNMWFNFPHIDLSKFDIITSDTTEDAFKTKKADEIKLR